MDKDSSSKESANPSGAPEFGGATTRQSRFGGRSIVAHILRFVARVGRDLETTAYRRLKDLESSRGGPGGAGSPNRTREAGRFPDDAHIGSV